MKSFVIGGLQKLKCPLVYLRYRFEQTQCIFTDNEKPILTTCAANQTKIAAVGRVTTIVDWASPTAIDNSREVVNVSCLPPSGSNFVIGRAEVICETADSSGNKGTCGFNINVNGMCIRVRVISVKLHLFRKETRRIIYLWPRICIVEKS